MAKSGSLTTFELPCSVKASANLNGPVPLNVGNLGTKILVSTLRLSGSFDTSMFTNSFFGWITSDDREVISTLTIVGAVFAVTVSTSIFSIFSSN